MLRLAIACGILSLTLVLAIGTAVHSSAPSFSPEFKQLQAQLEQSGFTVRLERSPQAGSYGSLQTRTRTVWINPVVQELGIAEPTIAHEAVHAAQHCATRRHSPEANQLKPLGLSLETPNFLRPYFMRYKGVRRHVEREAYTVQARGDRLTYVSQLLKQHCSKAS